MQSIQTFPDNLPRAQNHNYIGSRALELPADRHF